MVALVTIITGSLLDVVGPLILREIIDNYVLAGKTEGLLTLGVVYLAVFLFIGVTVYVRLWMLSEMGHTALYRLRRDTFEHLQTLDLGFYSTQPAGEIMARCTNDIDRLETVLSGEVLNALASLLMISVMLGVMFTISPLLTVISLLVFPLVIAAALLNRHYERPLWRRWNNMNGKVVSFMQEHIAGVRVSHAYTRRKRNEAEFEDLTQEFYRKEMKAVTATGLIWPFSSDMVAVVGTALIIFFGGNLVLTGTTGVTAGALVLFLSYQAKFLRPVFTLSSLYSQLQTAFSSMERILSLLETTSQTPEKSDPIDLQLVHGTVEFRNVSFSYVPDKPVLEEFSLTIAPRETVAIVGETGAGKTTVTRLIPRFYDVPLDKGAVLIDGQDIRTVGLDSLRRKIGFVLQDPFLFSGTVRENLTYGKDIADNELMDILEMVGASFVHDLVDGLDTEVGERGSQLSMGQRQLISLARALVVNPQIILMDEATSSVDPMAELQIQSVMQHLLSDRTAVIVAHRLSTVRDSDRIVVLDKGRVIEDGSYTDLMEKQGHFYTLYQTQFRMQEKMGLSVV